MRDFEDDFDFEFEEGAVKCLNMKGFRTDTYPSMSHGSVATRRLDTEREKRIQAHQKRVQMELKNE